MEENCLKTWSFRCFADGGMYIKFQEHLNRQHKCGRVGGIFQHRDGDRKKRPAGDQPNPGCALGVMDGEGQCDCTTQGVPDKHRPGKARRVHKANHTIGIFGNRLETRSF